MADRFAKRSAFNPHLEQGARTERGDDAPASTPVMHVSAERTVGYPGIRRDDRRALPHREDGRDAHLHPCRQKPMRGGAPARKVAAPKNEPAEERGELVVTTRSPAAERRSR